MTTESTMFNVFKYGVDKDLATNKMIGPHHVSITLCSTGEVKELEMTTSEIFEFIAGVCNSIELPYCMMDGTESNPTFRWYIGYGSDNLVFKLECCNLAEWNDFIGK